MHRHATSHPLGSSFRGSVPQFTPLIALLGAIALHWATSSSATAQEVPSFDRTAIEPAVERLLDAYAGVRVHRDSVGGTIFYGAPMQTASDPDLAVEGWWAAHSAAFGVTGEDRQLQFVTPFADGRGTVYAYRLTNGPIEVEGGVARLIVRVNPTTGASEVTYAAARTAFPPVSGFPVVTVPTASARATAILTLPDPALTWQDPALVITPGTMDELTEVEIPARLAWHVSAHRTDASTVEAWTVIIDPTTGNLIEVRDEIVGVDITGEVTGMVSPAPRPDVGTNQPVLLPIGGARTRTIPGLILYSEVDGSFLLPNAGTAPITVESNLDGKWISINDFAGLAEMSFTTSATPPGPVEFFYNPSGNEFLQAQLNGFHFGILSHDFFRDRTTGIPGLDVSLPCNVNINDVCNAGFDPIGQSINFFRAGSGCANTAFSNVISHEYGHFIVNRLGLGQGSFGEGFGDVVAMMMYDDPIIGRDFQGPGTNVRDPLAANIQFPCTGEVHVCGQILGAVWWRIRAALGNNLGSQAGLDLTSQMFVDWSLITIGGGGPSGAQSTTAIEVLTIDDDDGLLDNGSPNFGEICNAFAAHSIDCPPIPPVAFSFTSPQPSLVAPNSAVNLSLAIDDGLETPIPTTAAIHVRAAGATSYTVTPMAVTGPAEYLATIPAQACGGTLEYFFSVSTTAGFTRLFPTLGSGAPFEAPVYDIVETVRFENLETNTGWVVGAASDTATAGIWERVNPVGTAAAPENDQSSPGTMCYVTGQGLAGGTLGAQDVDNGPTTLMTPPLDLSAPGDYRIQYWRWFSNDSGAQANTEVFQVDVSGNNGASWSSVEVVGPTGPETSGGWISHSFNVGALVPLTSNVRVRFIATDPAPGSLVEAGVDDLEVIRFGCDPAPSFQRGDVTGNGTVNLADAVALLSATFVGTPTACRDSLDTNDSGTIDLSDAIGLLNYLFSAGNPPAPPFGTCGPDATDDPIDCLIEPTCP